MQASAWAHARIEGSAAEVAGTIPRITGRDGTRLRVERGPEALASPAGATRFAATWHADRDQGEAEITILPILGWGCEVHVAVAAPLTRTGRLRWRASCLRSLASSLALAVTPGAGDEIRVDAAPSVPRSAIQSAGA
jgi:hypothetical protein